jgi:hypothetical protein
MFKQRKAGPNSRNGESENERGLFSSDQLMGMDARAKSVYEKDAEQIVRATFTPGARPDRYKAQALQIKSPASAAVSSMNSQKHSRPSDAFLSAGARYYQGSTAANRM